MQTCNFFDGFGGHAHHIYSQVCNISAGMPPVCPTYFFRALALHRNRSTPSPSRCVCSR